MATANFHDRIDRIQRSQTQAPEPKRASFRTPGIAGVAAMNRVKRRRRQPIMEHLVSTAFGILLGCLVAVALIGLSTEGALWGPGSELHDLAYYPIMAGLGLAPILMLISLFTASSRPAFALFSLGYLSGIVVPIFF